MLAVWKRELQSYYYTPVGYVFMTVFLVLSGIMFFMSILQPRSGDLLIFIGQMGYLWMLLSPVLTMKLLAEEKQKHTDQLLLTSPVSVPGIVLGKYLAAVTVMLLTVLITFAYVGVMGLYGTVYPGEVMVGYLGFVLEGCAFIAVDMFLSSCTGSPVSAAIAAFGVNFALWILDLLVDSVGIGFVETVLRFISLYRRNEPFLMGQLSFASVIYDVSFALVFVLLTCHRLDARRYQGA
ncbi:MAG: ABC transporter permease [Clostridia bacterium]|nr:ABC transporter permease [Clostridia bacterium]